MKYISRTKKKSTTTALILHPDKKKTREKKNYSHDTYNALRVIGKCCVSRRKKEFTSL